MKVYLPGDSITALCPTCGRQQAIFAYGPFSMSDGITVPDVMQAFCSKCKGSVVVAPQSAARIKQSRRDEEMKSTSVRLPLVLWDVATSLVAKMGSRVSAQAPEQVLLAFLSLWIRQPRKRKQLAEKLRQASVAPVMTQEATRKVSLVLSAEVQRQVEEVMQKSSLSSFSELLRCCLWLAIDEPLLQKELECFLLVNRSQVRRKSAIA